MKTQLSYLESKECVILSEAGSQIGFGHLTRCTALADSLCELGCKVHQVLLENGFEPEEAWKTMPWITAPSEVIRRYPKANVVIIDSYLATPSLYSYFQCQGKMVVAIDDFNRIVYPANLIINPNVFFPQINYSNQSAKTVGGRDYVILRKPFRKELSHREGLEHPIKILVTLGGSDFRQLLPTVVQVVGELKFLPVTVISPEGYEKRLGNERVIFLKQQNADQMLQNMMDADIVISACGQTLHELAALGKATVGICLDIDQIPNQKFYLQEGFLAAELQWDQFNLKEELFKAVSYFFPEEHRVAMALLGPQLINKNGVTNVANLVNKAVLHAI
ncbi:MAG: hypothetical protein NWS63_14645 [Saprospiraceae bacterium]|nr:hypothetical protein [Saprospiraceae bacterium]